MLYGQKTTSYSSTIGGGSPFNYAQTTSGFHPGVDGSLAVSYSFSPTTKLSLGYQAQFWSGVFDKISDSGVSSEDRVIQGPFVRLTAGF